MFDSENKFNEIVFENRNKNYGAYPLRKSYPKVLGFSVSAALIFFFAVISVLQFRSISNNYDSWYNEQRTVIYEPVSTRQYAALPSLPKNKHSEPIQKENPEKLSDEPLPIISDSVKDQKPEAGKKNKNEKDSSGINSSDSQFTKKKLMIKHETNPASIFFVVDQMPQFPGGSEAVLDFISKNLVIPQISFQKNIFGTVYVAFCVTDSGIVDNIHLAKGLYPQLDTEAVRVIGMFPKWNPGILKGSPVNVWQTLPVCFTPKN